MQTSFSKRELARLTKWDRKKIDGVFESLSDEPTLEEIVAAFITTASKSPNETPPMLFSQSELHRLTGLDRNTVMDRLDTVASHPGPKNSKLYALADALPALIAGRDLSLDEIKKRRESHKEKREEIELKKTLRKLVDYNEVRTELQEIFKALHRRVAINFWREHAPRLKKAKTSAELMKIGQEAQGKIFDALRSNYKALTGSDQSSDS
jgi:uncharacterized protein DUF1441